MLFVQSNDLFAYQHTDIPYLNTFFILFCSLCSLCVSLDLVRLAFFIIAFNYMQGSYGHEKPGKVMEF